MNIREIQKNIFSYAYVQQILRLIYNDSILEMLKEITF